MKLLYITFPLFYYFINNYLIVMLFAMDNIFISYNTIGKIYNYNIIDFYEQPYIDRYIYYFLISLLNPILYLILYIDVTILLFMTTIPPIFAFILLNINSYIVSIKYYMNKIKNNIIYAFINYFLKLICLTTLKLDPCFTKKEISTLYKENYKEHVLLLIKNFILLTVIKAISDGSTISLSIIKKIYNTKAVYQYNDPLPNINNNIEKIKDIIMKRKFKLLFNPYVLDIITKLYEQEQITHIIPKVNTFFNDLELCTAKMLAIVTLSKLWSSYMINGYILIGIISIGLSPLNRKNLIIKIIGTFVSYLCDNYYLGCMVCEYSDLLLSQICNWYYEQFKKIYKNNIHLISHCNKYNDIILFNSSYLYLLNNMDNILIIFYLITNSKYPLITIYFVFCGYMSNYSIMHMVLLSLFLYLFINLYYFKSAPIPKIPLTIITNYTQKINIVKNINIVDDYIKNDHKPKPINYKPLLKYDYRCHVLNSMHNPKYIIPPI